MRRNVLLLILTITVFSISSIVSLYSHHQASQLVSRAFPLSVWSINRLEIEHLKLLHSLEMFKAGKTDHAQLLEHFDILWNRTEVILESEREEHITELEKAGVLVTAISATLHQIDPLVIELERQPEHYDKVYSELAAYREPIRDLQLENFSDRNTLYRIDFVASNFKNLSFFLSGILISGALLVLLLIRETRRSQHQALHDALTGLPNRSHFITELDRLIHLASREKRLLAVMLIDLNKFKEINDSLGHNAGDQLLQGIAERLQRSIRHSDIAARLGGDEFAILQYPLEDAEQAAQLAEQVSQKLLDPIQLSDGQCVPGCAIGISLYPDDSNDHHRLMINADMAMYQAKEQQDTCYRFYEMELHNELQVRKRLYQDLNLLLEHSPETELKLHYQPILELNTGEIVATEALLRWFHPVHGAIPPLKVIDVAEHYGLSRKLGRWVLATACRDLALIQQRISPTFIMTVNISPAMYSSGTLVDDVTAQLQACELDARCLTLEVTEDTTMQDLGANLRVLHQLRQLGCQIALDDFGTGYSSLSHLYDLPVQVLKADRTFISRWRQNSDELSVLRAIIQLGNTLGLKVVAEGIEQKADLDVVRSEGSQYGQGYYFYKPMAMPELLAELDKNQQVDKKKPAI